MTPQITPHIDVALLVFNAFVLFFLDPVVTRLLQRGLPRDSAAS